MAGQWGGGNGDGSHRDIAVDTHVRVFPGSSREVYGVVVEDFGDLSGESVEIGEHHIADAARRWAVQLADGSLVFVDDTDIAPAR